MPSVAGGSKVRGSKGQDGMTIEHSGFTLIELMIVAILGLPAIAIPAFSKYVRSKTTDGITCDAFLTAR